MFRALSSLRIRVLFWYTALLGVVIVIFGGTVCLLAWRARLAEVDAMLAARARALAGALEMAPDGTFDLVLPPEAAPGAPGLPALYFVLWTPAGQPIDRSDPALDVPVPDEPGARTRLGRRELTVTAPAGPLVLVGRDMADIRAEIWALAGRLGFVGLGALVVAFGGGWLLVGRALAPIDRISRTARAMSAGDLAARIPLENVETDLEQLARVLNDAFDRLHAAVERQKRFTADASHELRTPLTTMSTELQWSLGRTREPDAYRQSLEACRRAVERMTATVGQLLDLARADAGPPDRHRPMRLDELVARVCAELAPLARARAVSVEQRVVPVTVHGDPDRLRGALTNLVSNAIQYNQEGGSVVVSAAADNRLATLTIADTGIGIAPDDLDRIFEPFFRADPARSRDAGGAGLGLSVAARIVEQHGGRIDCSSRPGAGTTMTIRLPEAPGGQPEPVDGQG
jgi:signal transduction histidine kinase